MFVAYELFDVVDVLFYVLFVGYGADQEHVVGVGDYVVVETVDHHEFVFAGHGVYVPTHSKAAHSCNTTYSREPQSDRKSHNTSN